jgi:hypothetical protein
MGLRWAAAQEPVPQAQPDPALHSSACLFNFSLATAPLSGRHQSPPKRCDKSPS